MKLSRFLVLLVIGVGLGQPAGAAEPDCSWWQTHWHPRSQRCPCCPDDYCPKALPPHPCPVSRCGPDDYCPKPQPATCPYNYCGVNDYCPKACPIVLPPCYPPWYTCGCPKANP
jgi:hypothetical protein